MGENDRNKMNISQGYGILISMAILLFFYNNLSSRCILSDIGF